jgi:hypothetical protein
MNNENPTNLKEDNNYGIRNQQYLRSLRRM